MNKSCRLVFVTLLILASYPFAARAAGPSLQEVRTLAQEATIWAFPFVENYKLLSQTLDPKSPYYGLFNVLHHSRDLLTPADKLVVTPNNDTLYSSTSLDLEAEPMVLHVPEMGKRYYTFQIVDMATNNVGYIGTRATGEREGWYAFTGPGWKGALPPKVTKAIACPSRFMLIVGRTAVAGPGDLESVRKIQDRYELTPLSALTGAQGPKRTSVSFTPYDPQKVQSLEFFSYLNWLMQFHVFPPAEQDLLKKYSVLGIAPGKSFDIQALDGPTRAAMQEGLAAGLAKIKDSAGAIGRSVNGWSLAPAEVPYFGNDYLLRAAFAYKAIYVNDPAEAYYPAANNDADGQPLDGSTHGYVLRFVKDQLPSAKYFWSLTMYDQKDRLLVENPIHRYSIGDRTAGLQFAKDGSLTILIQRGSPGPDKESNWLPAPGAPFYVILRIYGPSEKVLQGAWTPPPLEKVK
jgi:hypothetical protein